MRRNETKKLMLTIAEDFAELAESSLFQVMAESQYGFSLSMRAVEMSLLRCHRQGLLHRKNGKYQISPRGEARLAWLRSTVP
jgi:hypothetical protein